MKLSSLPHQDRPREKLLAAGTGCLTDMELMAVMLGTGSRKNGVLTLAGKILSLCDKKGGRLSVQDLKKVSGMGTAKTAALLAGLEFARRRIRPEGTRIKKPQDIYALAAHLADRRQEHFLCFSLNGAHEVINMRVIAIGLVDRAQVHPREVFADAIVDRASFIAVAHNHPAGGLKPSSADLAVTEQLKKAGDLLGIRLLDHVIFNSKGFFSLMEKGMM
ncbi:MAG: DNA repair protein RadC [Candidatus Wallbacteria bacterium]|nr:DNA repair protein RadC [Candidatus Wallbacteria bacterium]